MDCHLHDLRLAQPNKNTNTRYIISRAVGTAARAVATPFTAYWEVQYKIHQSVNFVAVGTYVRQ